MIYQQHHEESPYRRLKPATQMIGENRLVLAHLVKGNQHFQTRTRVNV
jgi:hypothetical protein